MTKYFILLKSTLGKFGTGRIKPLSTVPVDSGSLWRVCDDDQMATKVFPSYPRVEVGSQLFVSIENRAFFLITSPENMSPISNEYADLLLAVLEPKERIRLLHAEGFLRNASRLIIGDQIDVKMDGNVLPARLRFIGLVPILGVGTFFGVEVPRGSGISDGIFNGCRLFQCPPQSGLLGSVSMLQIPRSIYVLSTPSASSVGQFSQSSSSYQYGARSIRPMATEPRSAASAKNDFYFPPRERAFSEPKYRNVFETLGSSSDFTARDPSLSPNTSFYDSKSTLTSSAALAPLELGERVVFLRDGEPENGTVRWLGNINGLPTKMAGIEFDHPIGSGTGVLNGRRLFHTPLDHASIVPIEGLIRANDYGKTMSTGGNSNSDVVNDHYSDIRKDLLLDLDGDGKKDGFDTTVWSENDHPVSPSPFLVTTTTNDFSEQRVMDILGIDHEVRVGAYVDVYLDVNITTPLLTVHGVVRWMGEVPGQNAKMVGVELDEDLPFWIRLGCDGTYGNHRYFSCSSHRGVFVTIDKVKVRLTNNLDVGRQKEPSPSVAAGQVLDESMPALPGPWSIDNYFVHVGKGKGIQGKSNSCYLDATLFALFATTDAFDSILEPRPKRRADSEYFDEIRTTLKFQIVAALRWRGFVEEHSVMKLRRLLAHVLHHDGGWTTDEKDPEELINALFGPALGVNPDIRFITGHSSHLCQLVIEDAFEKAMLTSVQTLVDRSFFCSDVLLKKMPDRFIVQLPRYGKQKLYEYIVPSLRLDLSNVLSNRGRKCAMCEQEAHWQCKECFMVQTNEYAMTFFCDVCFHAFHSGLRTNNDHKPTPVAPPKKPIDSSPSAELELVAVICIKSSHYVTYARIRNRPDSEEPGRWIFCDSMADREGGDVTGHNIPEVVECDPYFELLLRPQNRHLLVDALPAPIGLRREHRTPNRSRRSSNPLPPFIERLMEDAYTCIYVRPDA